MASKDYTLKNKLNYKLDDKQNDIVEALLNNDYFFNCAQTGLGKTFSTITAAVHNMVIRKEQDIHYILLLPNSAVKAFNDTLTKILGLPYSIYTARKTRVRENARFHIFNYSTLGKDIFKEDTNPLDNPYFKTLARLRKKHKNLFLIADEAHALQDPKTTQYKTVKLIKPWFMGMWFLTATPILNNLEGFYHMVNLLKSDFFKSIYAFNNKYHVYKTKTIWKKTLVNGVWVPKPMKIYDVVDYKNLDHLKEMFDKISIVRSKEYNIVFNYRETKLSKSSKEFYKKAAEGLFSGKVLKVNKKTGKKITKKTEQQHAGARLHDLQRVVSNSHPDFQDFDKNKITEKELLLINTVKEVINRNEAVLIYFSYLETLDRIKYIFNYLKTKLNIPAIHEVSGNISQQKRKIVEDAIKPRDIVLITSAGTESINLQKANNLIFYEIPFPLREFIQASGRIARTNSEYDEMNIYILEARGTIDTYKKNRIMMNSAAIKSVLGGSNTLPVENLKISLADKEEMKNELLWWD
jgi:superfamily II DNA or RNA helicase